MIAKCPFCKSNEVEVQEGSFVCWVACMKCDANGPPSESIDEAIKLWNLAEETGSLCYRVLGKTRRKALPK